MQGRHELPCHSNGLTQRWLTQRETQVLQLIAEGCSTKELAYKLGICFRTAVCHRNSLMRKLNVHNAATLIRYAIRNGIIQAFLAIGYLHELDHIEALQEAVNFSF
jgi:DNA-binding NarL/FixJ family response regulator